MILRIFLFIVCWISTLDISAQITIQEDAAISEVMSIYSIKANESSAINGWRIQLINTDDRRKMEAAKSKFYGLYPNIPIKWEHVQPYYQVKIGEYKTRMDLEPFLQELRVEFPRAIPIRDVIEKIDLIDDGSN